MKLVLGLFFPLIILFSCKSEVTNTPQLESKVHNWRLLDVEKTSSGERRQILDGQTLVFDQLEIHATSLNPGQAPHASHVHQDSEELVIIKDGFIKQTIGEEEKILGPGSIVLAMPGDEHGISNAGETMATYYIIKWRTQNFSALSLNKRQPSVMLNWEDFVVDTNEKGNRRNVIKQPTIMVDELEMHVTTLNEGMKSHDQHTHIDEEIILVLSGEVEELINDVPHKAEAGSVIFLNSEIPHGIRNIGDGPCSYFAIRWIPKDKTI